MLNTAYHYLYIKTSIALKNLILASTSTLYNGSYLDYLIPELEDHFSSIKTLIFIPFARPGGIDHDTYTQKVKDVFNPLGIAVKGIHEFKDPKAALSDAEGVFTSGGNTFLLVNQLYKLELMPILRNIIFQGTPYLGTSAGSNIGGVTMQTTNDMPIIYPPSFKTLGAVPFNINPHYLDPPVDGKHMGESRETRIKEFHQFNTLPVVGLREGSWIQVKDDRCLLKGELTARVFEQNKEPREIESGENIIFD